MIKSIIIDDEAKSISTLKTLLEQCHTPVQVIGEAQNAKDAYNLIIAKQEEVDVLFLDVEMPIEDGFDLLSKFSNPFFRVVFVTAYDRFALKAIRCSALDYLLKPVNINELQATIKKIEAIANEEKTSQQYYKLLENIRIWRNGQEKMAVPHREGFEFLTFDEIIRIEADGNYSIIYCTGKRKLVATRKISVFEDMLKNLNFFRVHRSHLINLSYLKAFRKSNGGLVILEGNTQVPVAKSRFRLLTQRYKS